MKLAVADGCGEEPVVLSVELDGTGEVDVYAAKGSIASIVLFFNPRTRRAVLVEGVDESLGFDLDDKGRIKVDDD